MAWTTVHPLVLRLWLPLWLVAAGLLLIRSPVYTDVDIHESFFCRCIESEEWLPWRALGLEGNNVTHHVFEVKDICIVERFSIVSFRLRWEITVVWG